jgi:predicted ester cyclase
MTRQDVEALLARHARSFQSRDADRLASDHVEDGTFYSPAAGHVRGRSEIRRVYEYWLNAFPDMSLTWESPLIDGDRAALFWRFAGTLQGKFFGDVKPGTKVEFAGAAEMTLSPDGIVSVNHLFDFTGALVAAGAIKVKPQ